MSSLTSSQENLREKFQHQYLKKLHEKRKEILKSDIKKNNLNNWSSAPEWVIKEERLFYKDKLPKKCRALQITITPTGCRWADISGGCSMCGEYFGSNCSNHVVPYLLITQFIKTLTDQLANYYSYDENLEWIKIFNEGTFFDENELDPVVAKALLKIAANVKNVKRVTIEGVANKVTKENIEELRKVVPKDVELEIGIGIEAKSDFIRNVCINKQDTLKEFERAVAILKSGDCKSLAYVLLKPLFLTEGQGIVSAKESIKYAFDAGFDAVSLEPMSIHEWSFAHVLNVNNQYELPWFWSVKEVIKDVTDVREEKDIRIGGCEYHPRSISHVHNRKYQKKNNIHPKSCTGKTCNLAFIKSVKKYNATHNLKVFNSPRCGCEKYWRKEKGQLKRIDKEIEESIEKYMNRVFENLREDWLEEYIKHIQNVPQIKRTVFTALHYKLFGR